MKRALLLVCALALLSGCSYILPESNQPPKAYITSISPAEVTEGDVVGFSGHGTDVDGQVVGYLWRSNLDGHLSESPGFETHSLSVGDHDISFMVQDDQGAWSIEVWGTVKVTPLVAVPATITSFAASPETIVTGDTAAVSWEVSDATAVSIDPGIGTVPAAGSVQVSPDVSTTYTLTATGGGATVTAQVTVTVMLTQPELAIDLFTADPVTVPSGETTTLSWATTGATEVQIQPEIGLVPASGSVDVTVHGEEIHTFTLVVTDGEHTLTSDVEIWSYALMLPPTLHTITLTANTGDSGYVLSTGVAVPNFINVGDNADNVGIQAFVSFDMPPLPSDAVIESVVPDLSDYVGISGTPFADLGCLRAYAHDYGVVHGGLYVPIVMRGSIGYWCSQEEIDTPGSGNSAGFKQAFQKRIGSDRFQIRLQFTPHGTDNDGLNDQISWSKGQLPRLVVQYYSYDD